MYRRMLVILAVLLAVTAAAVPAGFAAKPNPKTVKTDVGVTASTISLGVLTDFTGPFAAAGKVQAPAAQMYWADINAKGGVCGRKVKLLVENHGYNPQNAVSVYQKIAPSILAVQQMLGSPTTAAVLPLAMKDHVVLSLIGWSSFFAKNTFTTTTGTTYDIAMIDGIHWLFNKGMIKKGDKIGAIYFAGDYGGNALLGVKYAAAKLGLTVVEASISPAVTDLSTQLANFKAQGVKAIAAAVAPPQIIGMGGAQKALNYNVPIIGPQPNYLATYAQTPVGDQLAKTLYYATPILSWVSKSKPMQALVAEWNKKHKALGPDITVAYAVAGAQVFYKALKIGCARGDLTRNGFIRAVHAVKNLKTGLMTPLSFNVGLPSGTSVYIERAADVPGGAKGVAGPYTSPLVKGYKLP